MTPGAAGSASPAPSSTGTWFTRGGWWFLVHAGSLGLLAAVPFTHAAVLSRRIGHGVLAAAVLVTTVLAFLLIEVGAKDAAGHPEGFLSGLGGTLLMLVLIGGLASLVVVRHQVFGPKAASRAPQPALARALAARTRRDEARRLAGSDPLLARDLRIGRPDLPREYDDGGLVDLNSAPAPVVAAVCGLEPVHAEGILGARRAAGRFASVEDVFAWAELPVEVWDRVRDRGVVL
jgi:DNA uptake protein ComE-like DNA-binding protein